MSESAGSETPVDKPKPRARKQSHKKKSVTNAPSVPADESSKSSTVPDAPQASDAPTCEHTNGASSPTHATHEKRKRTPDAPCIDTPAITPRTKKSCVRNKEIVDLDAEPAVEITADTARYYVCYNHHTARGSGHASTLVCATDIVSAQRTLDAWLAKNKLQPLEKYPYQLREISTVARGGMIVSSDDVVRMDLAQPHQPHASGHKGSSYRVFTYQDVPFTDDAVIGRGVVAGAVLVANDEADAATILTEALWKKSLLTRDLCVPTEAMECVIISALGPDLSDYVVPLSLYMCAE